MRVKFIDQSKGDLADIKDHYRIIGGALLAKKMILQIRLPVMKLEHNPEIAPPYEISPGIRRLVVAGGIFLVFYRLRANIEVLHVRSRRARAGHG